jgi:hypothetical protein
MDRIRACIRSHDPLCRIQQCRQSGIQQVLVQVRLVARQQQLKAGQLQFEVL